MSSDQIDGFVNTGSYKNQELADHALVFMIRGITKKNKQPVAYSFCQGATKQEELVKQLKSVILLIKIYYNIVINYIIILFNS